jgi:hypothetical protein
MEVTQKYIVYPALDKLQSFQNAGRSGHLKALEPQKLTECVADDLVVIHQKNSDGRHSVPPYRELILS